MRKIISKLFTGKVESPPLEKKYQMTLDKINALPLHGTLVIMVDSLSKTSQFVKDLTPHLKGVIFFGNEQRMYFPLFERNVKFATLTTIEMLPLMFITEDEAKLDDALTAIDINPRILLDLEEIPDHDFGGFVNVEDVLWTLELLRKRRQAQGKPVDYSLPQHVLDKVSKVKLAPSGGNTLRLESLEEHLKQVKQYEV